MTEPIRVLVVDDHQMFGDALRILLSDEEDIEVHGPFTTAEQALEHCGSSSPDVVLMDMDLPGMDGSAAARKLREMCPNTHVVMVTAAAERDVLQRAIEAGAVGYVPKTRAADELVSVIRRAAAGEVVLPARSLIGLLREAGRRRQQRSGEAALLERLTERERAVLRELSEGKSTPEVAQALFISIETVHSHVKSVIAKLGVRSKLEAVLLAVKNQDAIGSGR